MDLDASVRRNLLRAIIEDKVTKEELLNDLFFEVLTMPKPIFLFINEWGNQTTYLFNGKPIPEDDFNLIKDCCERMLDVQDFCIIKAPSIIQSNIPLANSEDDVIM